MRTSAVQKRCTAMLPPSISSLSPTPASMVDEAMPLTVACLHQAEGGPRCFHFSLRYCWSRGRMGDRVVPGGVFFRQACRNLEGECDAHHTAEPERCRELVVGPACEAVQWGARGTCTHTHTHTYKYYAAVWSAPHHVGTAGNCAGPGHGVARQAGEHASLAHSSA